MPSYPQSLLLSDFVSNNLSHCVVIGCYRFSQCNSSHNGYLLIRREKIIMEKELWQIINEADVQNYGNFATQLKDDMEIRFDHSSKYSNCASTACTITIFG